MEKTTANFMRLHCSLLAAMFLLCCSSQGLCGQGAFKSLKNPTALPVMLSVMMWQKFSSLNPGMTPVQAMSSGPFVPMSPVDRKHPGWCTLEYAGPLTAAETKLLQGKVMVIDVQLVRKPGPACVSNPPGGCLNPSSGEIIAAVSAPYLSDGGPVYLD